MDVLVQVITDNEKQLFLMPFSPKARQHLALHSSIEKLLSLNYLLRQYTKQYKQNKKYVKIALYM